MLKNLRPYIISTAIALAVGGLSAYLTRGNTDIYETITKPAFSPPAILFPIVWTLLYALMGISAAAVFNRRETRDVSAAMKTYALQLAVNFFWSIIFFNMRAYLFAFVWIAVLWLLIILMIVEFYKIRRGAAYLQIPYFLWVTFASYLTLMIYLLN